MSCDYCGFIWDAERWRSGVEDVSGGRFGGAMKGRMGEEDLQCGRAWSGGLLLRVERVRIWDDWRQCRKALRRIYWSEADVCFVYLVYFYTIQVALESG